MTWLMPLPLTVSCFSKIRVGFTFLVPAYPGSPGQRAVKRVFVLFFQRSACGQTGTRTDKVWSITYVDMRENKLMSENSEHHFGIGSDWKRH